MPVMQCQLYGKLGHRWGSSGKCYVGPDSKEEAEKVDQAMEG